MCTNRYLHTLWWEQRQWHTVEALHLRRGSHCILWGSIWVCKFLCITMNIKKLKTSKEQRSQLTQQWTSSRHTEEWWYRQPWQRRAAIPLIETRWTVMLHLVGRTWQASSSSTMVLLACIVFCTRIPHPRQWFFPWYHPSLLMIFSIPDDLLSARLTVLWGEYENKNTKLVSSRGDMQSSPMLCSELLWFFPAPKCEDFVNRY